MSIHTTSQKTVAIIGGGVSGALTAFHLARQHTDARIVILDPRPKIGLGLAYSTPSLLHLLNVPAGKISALPSEPNHFLKWLHANHDPQATAGTFAPRAVFGAYIRSVFTNTPGIESIQASVTDLRPGECRAELTLDNGNKLASDLVVLATGNFDPGALPGITEAAVKANIYCHNAWVKGPYDNLDANAPVVLIGTGLTAVDVILRLRELGHRGVITTISRNGVFPNPHADYTPINQPVIPLGTSPTCKAYLRALRAAIKNGAEWRAAVDSVRPITNELWLALPKSEQLRFRRHLQAKWDVIRHRMPGQVSNILQAEISAGTLVMRKGSLAGVDVEGAGAAVAMRSADGLHMIRADRVINCTGPGMNYKRVNSPLLKSLFEQGLIAPGTLGGGFNSDCRGALIGADGKSCPWMFTLGPGRLGTLFESIAIPEIRQQAVALAATLADLLRTTNPALDLSSLPLMSMDPVISSIAAS